MCVFQLKAKANYPSLSSGFGHISFCLNPGATSVLYGKKKHKISRNKKKSVDHLQSKRGKNDANRGVWGISWICMSSALGCQAHLLPISRHPLLCFQPLWTGTPLHVGQQAKCNSLYVAHAGTKTYREIKKIKQNKKTHNRKFTAFGIWQPLQYLPPDFSLRTPGVPLAGHFTSH